MSTNPGTSWNLQSAGSTSMSWYSAAWSPELGIFVAVGAPVGSAASVVIYSADGITWTKVNSPTNALGSQMAWFRVTWSPLLGLFVAVGGPVTPSADLGRVMTSPDGRVWTIRTTASTGTQAINWNNVVWSPDLALLVAVGQDNAGSALTNLAMTSPDGVTWTMHAAPAGSPADVVWYGLAWSPSVGLLVATGVSPTSASGTHVMTSPDGATWTGRTSPADSGGGFVEVVWSPDWLLFAAVSDVPATTSVMTSPDGVTWTTRTLGSTGQWFALAWIPVFSIALGLGFGATYGGTNQKLTSTNGTAWSVGSFSGFSPATQTWRSIAYAPALLRAVAVANTAAGDGAIATSDGVFTPTSSLQITTGSSAGGGGFTDVSDATLAAGQVLTDDTLVKISENAKLAAVRAEIIFMGFYANGAEVPLPQSPVDGYLYSKSELVYEWTLFSTRGPDAHFVNGQAEAPGIGAGLKLGQPTNIYWTEFDIDDATGKVSTLVSYFSQGVVPETITNDGVLKVYAVCQRASVSVSN